jgi:hypothetical protein
MSPSLQQQRRPFLSPPAFQDSKLSGKTPRNGAGFLMQDA